MEKIKTYGSLFLVLVASFVLGGYSMGVIYNIKPVEPHQWILTSLFGLYFLMISINRLKK